MTRGGDFGDGLPEGAQLDDIAAQVFLAETRGIALDGVAAIRKFELKAVCRLHFLAPRDQASP